MAEVTPREAAAGLLRVRDRRAGLVNAGRATPDKLVECDGDEAFYRGVIAREAHE